MGGGYTVKSLIMVLDGTARGAVESDQRTLCRVALQAKGAIEIADDVG